MPRWIWPTWLTCALGLGWLAVYCAFDTRLYERCIAAGFMAASAACALESMRSHRRRARS